MFSVQDSRWMAQALRLAEQGLNGTSPNPRVGCVLVAREDVVGTGWHRRAGEPHAEVHALREAGGAARGATAYVTLEPCSHHGRTPPCADALIQAGVARVVVAVQDPNPQVAGEGMEKLRAAGVKVESGLMEAEARELNVGFFSRMTRGTPWLRSKIAMSLDGRTALVNGVSQWITGEAARADVHRWRARSCAVMTGIDTVLADDAQLNVRGVETSRQPLRVVLDSRLRMPLNARILGAKQNPSLAIHNKEKRQSPPAYYESLSWPLNIPHRERQSSYSGGGDLLIYSATQDAQKIAALEKVGATVCVLPDGEGQVDLAAMLSDLAKRGCNEVLLEAGSKLNGALLRGGLVDELLLYVAPQLLGDMARGVAQLGALTSLDQRVNLKWRDVRQVGNDLRITVKVEKG